MAPCTQAFTGALLASHLLLPPLSATPPLWPWEIAASGKTFRGWPAGVWGPWVRTGADAHSWALLLGRDMDVVCMEHQDLLLFVLGNGDYSELVCMHLSPYPPSPPPLLEPAGGGCNTRAIPSRILLPPCIRSPPPVPRSWGQG